MGDLSDRIGLLVEEVRDLAVGIVEVVVEDEGPELIGGNDVSEGVEKVVPLGAHRGISGPDLRCDVLLFPVESCRLPPEHVGHLVVDDLAQVGQREVGPLPRRDAPGRADQSLLGHLFQHRVTTTEDATGFGADVAVDRLEEVAVGPRAAAVQVLVPACGEVLTGRAAASGLVLVRVHTPGLS